MLDIWAFLMFFQTTILCLSFTFVSDFSSNSYPLLCDFKHEICFPCVFSSGSERVPRERTKRGVEPIRRGWLTSRGGIRGDVRADGVSKNGREKAWLGTTQCSGWSLYHCLGRCADFFLPSLPHTDIFCPASLSLSLSLLRLFLQISSHSYKFHPQLITHSFIYIEKLWAAEFLISIQLLKLIVLLLNSLFTHLRMFIRLSIHYPTCFIPQTASTFK